MARTGCEGGQCGYDRIFGGDLLGDIPLDLDTAGKVTVLALVIANGAAEWVDRTREAAPQASAELLPTAADQKGEL